MIIFWHSWQAAVGACQLNTHTKGSFRRYNCRVLEAIKHGRQVWGDNFAGQSIWTTAGLQVSATNLSIPIAKKFALFQASGFPSFWATRKSSRSRHAAKCKLDHWPIRPAWDFGQICWVEPEPGKPAPNARSWRTFTQNTAEKDKEYSRCIFASCQIKDNCLPTQLQRQEISAEQRAGFDASAFAARHCMQPVTSLSFKTIIMTAERAALAAAEPSGLLASVCTVHPEKVATRGAPQHTPEWRSQPGLFLGQSIHPGPPWLGAQA